MKHKMVVQLNNCRTVKIESNLNLIAFILSYLFQSYKTLHKMGPKKKAGIT